MKLKFLEDIEKNVKKQKQIVSEIESHYLSLKKTRTENERKMLLLQIDSLGKSLEEQGNENLKNIIKIGLAKSLENSSGNNKIPFEFQQPTHKQKILQENFEKLQKKKDLSSELEEETLKRIGKKGRKKVKVVKRKPNGYAKLANKLFANTSKDLIKKGKFYDVQRAMVKSKIKFIPSSYISILLFTTLLSIFGGVLLFLFFLFFNVSAALPIITLSTDPLFSRFLKVFWLLFGAPIGTFLFMYYYPSLEEASVASKINTELPFATIHMAAISGSMIDPSKIFNIIVSTGEYPYLGKEFIILINEINIYGYDLITALKNIALNSPSKKLAELLNGLSTTIGSGGNLPEFFQKRAETLMFNYRIEREKGAKTAETFMDIYISVVIATPMILMLLLIMMKISGLGLGLSTSSITLITVLAVFLINVVFLGFLQLKQPSE